MSTKTMPPPSRRVPWGSSPTLTSKSNSNDSHSHSPSTVNDKAKDRERDNSFQRHKRPHVMTTPTTPMTKLPKLMKQNNKEESNNQMNHKNKKPSNNQLLAGYLAHEYLTKGTLLGRRWDQLPSERVEPQQEEKYESYVALTCLLRTDGAHLSGIVNPTQLARYLRLR